MEKEASILEINDLKLQLEESRQELRNMRIQTPTDLDTNTTAIAIKDGITD